MRLPEDALEGAAREPFRFVLEREPASSILPYLSLEVITTYFPKHGRKLPKGL